ncbi:MAG TPA: alpha/beta hydrolase [Methylomirabilota bacterium]|nr:alpha/beta hydrolase [Methylomirabilota bacterium]
MPHLDRPDCRLYYETEGQGPALVFAHGLGGNHLSWWQQVPYFRERYTCVTFAHRGFPPSESGADTVGPFGFVDDLAALIDHLRLPDVRLVAQSMGGWTCLGYALREPSRVRALVMACTVGTVTHPDIDRVLAAPEYAAAQADLVRRNISPAAGATMEAEQPAHQYLYQAIGRLRVGLDMEATRKKLFAMRNTPASELAALTMPVLCISGEEDVLMPTPAIEALAKLMPRGRLARVPKSGHSVYFERPEIFNRLVGDFLREAGA